jgi:hypothetical protein
MNNIECDVKGSGLIIGNIPVRFRGRTEEKYKVGMPCPRAENEPGFSGTQRTRTIVMEAGVKARYTRDLAISADQAFPQHQLNTVHCMSRAATDFRAVVESADWFLNVASSG